MKSMQESDLMLMDTKQDIEFQEREAKRLEIIENRKRQIREEKNSKRERQAKPKKEKKQKARFTYTGEGDSQDEELDLGDYESSAYDKSRKSTVNKTAGGDLDGNQMDEEDIKPIDETRRARENKLKMLERMADQKDNYKEEAPKPNVAQNNQMDIEDSQEEVLAPKRKNKLKRVRKDSGSERESGNEQMPIKEARHLSN